MTLNEFVTKYNGKGVDFDKNGHFWCVDLYRAYCAEVLSYPQSPLVSGAKDIWENFLTDKFERFLNTPEAIPNKGDVMIWGGNVGGGYGHVAVFLEGDVNSFRSLDQNWPTGALVKIVNHKYTSVIGWLRPKEQPDNALAECLKSHADLLAQLIKQGEKLKKTEVKLAETENFLKNSRKSEAELKAKVGEYLEAEAIWQKTTEADNKKVKKLEENLAEETKLKLASIKRYNSARDEIIELKKVVDVTSYSTWDLLEIVFSRIKDPLIAWMKKVLHGKK